MKVLLTSKEAAAYLHISVNKLMLMVRSGMIVHYRNGARGKIFFKEIDLDHFLETIKVAAI